MSDKIRILQLGKQNWNEIYRFPENVILTFSECFEDVPKKPYDICFINQHMTQKNPQQHPVGAKQFQAN